MFFKTSAIFWVSFFLMESLLSILYGGTPPVKTSELFYLDALIYSPFLKKGFWKVWPKLLKKYLLAKKIVHGDLDNHNLCDKVSSCIIDLAYLVIQSV